MIEPLAAAPALLVAPALLQAGGAVPTTALEMVTHGTLASKIVLAILALLSLVSWAIMLLKWREFRAVERASRVFIREFEQSERLEEVVTASRRAEPSPFTRVHARAVHFLGGVRPPSGWAPGQSVGTLSGSQVEALRLVLDAETNAERDQLGRFIPWLATIGSASPLIGLFGTVIGVISAFTGIAARGSGNLGAVAPGIAEALVATAAALAVAIPAVFGYNLFATRLNRIDSELEGFGSELIALMAREGRI